MRMMSRISHLQTGTGGSCELSASIKYQRKLNPVIVSEGNWNEIC